MQPDTSHYLDGGPGSMLTQAFLASVLSIAFLVFAVWVIRRFIKAQVQRAIEDDRRKADSIQPTRKS